MIDGNYEKLVSLFRKYGNEGWYAAFYANDYPVPYKNLVLYPVEVSLYYVFHLFVECLLLPQMTSGDINAISKTYFEYLVYLADEKKELYHLQEMFELLSIVLHKPLKDEEGNDVISVIREDGKPLLKIENSVYDSVDFDVLRKIICEQNAIELPDEDTHPDILAAIKEVEEYKRKQAKVKVCSFEDQINVVVAKSSYRRDECIKMTIRSFSRLLERVDKIMHYEIMTLLSPNLTEEGKNSIEHYLAADKTREEKYHSAMVQQEQINNKINSIQGSR